MSIQTSADLWFEAWKVVATSPNTRDVTVARQWADQCLKDFLERFPRHFVIDQDPY